jgi:hypothetical protein
LDLTLFGPFWLSLSQKPHFWPLLVEFISEAMGDRGNLLTLDSKVSTQFKGEKTHQNWMQNKNSVYHPNYLM